MAETKLRVLEIQLRTLCIRFRFRDRMHTTRKQLKRIEQTENNRKTCLTERGGVEWQV